MGQWMLGCQTFIFIAMAEYGCILFLQKFKLRINDNDNYEFVLKMRSLDAWFLLLTPFLFLLFCVIFWIRISYLNIVDLE